MQFSDHDRLRARPANRRSGHGVGRPSRATARPSGSSGVCRRSRSHQRKVAGPGRGPSARLATLDHLADHLRALQELAGSVDLLESWGERLATALANGGRLLAVMDEGGAAGAELLAAELAERSRRRGLPVSAIAVSPDTRCASEAAPGCPRLACRVPVHGRRGDVLVAVSASGRASCVVEAVSMAHQVGLLAWSLSGSAAGRLLEDCDEALVCLGPIAVVQEMRLVAIHLLCEVIERALLGV